MTPKTVTVHMMYRDACNFKNCSEFVFTNTKGLDSDFIRDKLSTLEGDGFIASYYDIPNMAPYDNEFISNTGDDHSFTEYCDVEFDTCKMDSIDDFCETDISDVIAAIDDPGIVAGRRKEAHLEAIKILEDNLNDLKSMQL